MAANREYGLSVSSNNRGITVREEAEPALDGRPDQPVVFRGVEDTPGSWRGFWIYGGGMLAAQATPLPVRAAPRPVPAALPAAAS